MQLHSLIVSEPAGTLSGFGVGLITYYAAGVCGATPHTSLVIGCVSHFVTNTVVAGHVNLCLLDFLALVLIRVPAAAGSTMWMNHFVNTGHLL
ncbi:MAG: hypothetical protein QM757_35745 [Paludibaculum sp.]